MLLSLLSLCILFLNWWYRISSFRVELGGRMLQIKQFVCSKYTRRFATTSSSAPKVNPTDPASFPVELLPETIESWSGGIEDFQNLIVFQDAHVAVVFKPAGVPSQPSDTSAVTSSSPRKHIYSDEDLYSLLVRHMIWKGEKNDATRSVLSNRNHNQQQEQTKKPPVNNFSGIIHRLDRPASGLIIYAKSKLAVPALNAQFQAKHVQKYYFAIVNNAPSTSQKLHYWHNCEDYLLKTKESKTKVIVNPYQDSSKQRIRQDVLAAKMQYEILQQYTHKVTSTLSNITTKASAERVQTLLDINLITGRKHQLRAQLAHRHLPIVGDMKYTAPQSFYYRDIALHAYYLKFYDPLTYVPSTDPNHQQQQKGKVREFMISYPRIWISRFAMDMVEGMEKRMLSRENIEKSINKADSSVN
jgi:23S rRNA pseudouridine1911/1915/1917 synthase